MKVIPFILFILVWVLLYKYLANKKQKGKLLSHIFSLLAAIFILLLSAGIIAGSVTQEQKLQELKEQMIEKMQKKQ